MQTKKDLQIGELFTTNGTLYGNFSIPKFPFLDILLWLMHVHKVCNSDRSYFLDVKMNHVRGAVSIRNMAQGSDPSSIGKKYISNHIQNLVYSKTQLTDLNIFIF